MLSRAARSVKIAAMKRSFLLLAPFVLLALCSLLLFPAQSLASAAAENGENGYAAVVRRDAALLSEPDGDPLFVLPYTYFVRILGKEGGYYRVRYAEDRRPYQAVEGYCAEDGLAPVPFLPQTPYLERSVEFVYAIDDPGGAADRELLSVTRTFPYYGYLYDNGCLYYCVLDGGTLKRIPADGPLDYEENGEYADYVASLPAGGEEEDEGGLSAAAIAGICVACAAAVGVAALAARGKRPPAADPERAEF